MTAGGPFYLYVANIRAERIEVYDTNFKAVSLRGQGQDDDRAFQDQEIPDGFPPFNNSGNGWTFFAARFFPS